MSRARRTRPPLPVLPALALGAALFACGEGVPPGAERSTSPKAGAAGAWFEPVAAAAGLDFVHVRAAGTRFWFPEIMSGGAGWLDYDGDGDLDLYLVQGGDLARRDGGVTNRLYRNEGDGRFIDVTETAGVGDPGYGMGVVVADFDADGDPDLYVTNVGPNVLYRNQGDGRFTAVRAGVEDSGWGTSGAALDYDLDGDLDLFVVNYVVWSPEIELECYGVGGARDYCNPNRYQAPDGDLLFRNDGDLTFTDVSERVGLRRAFGNGLGVALIDFDGDPRLDVYVANDGMPNQLWVADGDGRFADAAVEGGCAVNGQGQSEAGMGVAVGDADGDGRLDLFLTHLGRETNTLYLNRGGFCEDATARAGLAAPSLGRTGFGTGFADFDLDGRLDLWVSNGRVGREELRTDRDPFAEPDQLFRGLGDGRFEAMPSAGSGVGGRADNSRAAAFADFDDDGDVDVVVVNNGGRARLYRNRAAGRKAGHWVQVLVAAAAGGESVGARVLAVAGGARQWRQVQRAYSYCSSNDPRVHFGLGDADRLEEVRVIVPGGPARLYRDLPAGKTYRVEL